MEQTPAAVATTFILHELGHMRERMTDLEGRVDTLKTEMVSLWESLRNEIAATDELLEVLTITPDEDPPHHIAHE